MTAFPQTIFASVVRGDRIEVEAEIREALESSIPPQKILNEGLIGAMTEVGRRFESGEFYVPEMLIAARAMQAGMAILKPHLVEEGVKALGKVVIGTVKGDLHDIGKNLVSIMLEGAGFEVVDLGVDVPPQRFVEAVQELQPQIVALSALLTTTMAQMGKTVDALRVADLRDKAKVIVGGAPLTESFAAKIGADGFAPDASRAATLAKTLID